MNGAFTADYFDGRTSARHAVDVSVEDERVAVRAEGIELDFHARDLRFRPRVAGAPIDIDLPDGGLLVAPFEHAAGSLRIPPATGLAHRLEAHVMAVIVSLAGLVVAGWLAYSEGIPWLARVVAERLPPQVEADIAKEGLRTLDSLVFRPTALPADERAALQEAFAQLSRLAGIAPPRLEFRDGGIVGPNAFSLPGGVVVITDQLVNVLPTDDLVMAVLAHEIGHLRHRDGARRILQASITGLLTVAVFGDVSAGTLAATIPAVLLSSSYSREQEREADAYAFELLRKSGRSPRLFADALRRLQSEDGDRAPRKPSPGAPRGGYLASHPDSEERMREAERAVDLTPPTRETP